METFLNNCAKLLVWMSSLSPLRDATQVESKATIFSQDGLAAHTLSVQKYPLQLPNQIPSLAVMSVSRKFSLPAG